MLSSTSLLKTSSEARTARWIVFCATMRTYSTPTQKITLTATCLSTGRAYVADRRAGVRNYLKKKQRKRTLEIYLGGDRTIGPNLRVLFARAVLGEEIDGQHQPGCTNLRDATRSRARLYVSTLSGLA